MKTIILLLLFPILAFGQVRWNDFTTNTAPFNVVPGTSIYVPSMYSTNVVSTNLSVTDYLFIGTAQVNYLTMLGAIFQQGVNYTNAFNARTNYFAGDLGSSNFFSWNTIVTPTITVPSNSMLGINISQPETGAGNAVEVYAHTNVIISSFGGAGTAYTNCGDGNFIDSSFGTRAFTNNGSYYEGWAGGTLTITNATLTGSGWKDLAGAPAGDTSSWQNFAEMIVHGIIISTNKIIGDFSGDGTALTNNSGNYLFFTGDGLSASSAIIGSDPGAAIYSTLSGGLVVGPETDGTFNTISIGAIDGGIACVNGASKNNITIVAKQSAAVFGDPPSSESRTIDGRTNAIYAYGNIVATDGFIVKSNSWLNRFRPILEEGDCLIVASNNILHSVSLLGGVTNVARLQP